MKIIYKQSTVSRLIISLLSLTLVACGGGSGSGSGSGSSGSSGGSSEEGNINSTSPKLAAINKIKTYARTGENPPTVQIYIDAGVTTVTESNLERVNAQIKTLDEEDVDTVGELEAIVTKITKVTIIKENKYPTVNAGQDKTATVNQTINITGSASDSDGTIVKYEWKIDKTVLASTPSFSYTPTSLGKNKISLTVTDNKGATASDSVIITVIDTKNHAPVANTVKVNILKDTTKTITLTATDTDGDTLSYHLAGYPTHGVISLKGEIATYKPNQGYTGIDSFSFKANDGKLDSPKADIFIQINNPPTYTKSFTEAKKEAAQIYLGHQKAFYSGCEYYAVEKKLIPLKDTCGYQTRKNEVRASRIEWEHVVSMWAMAHDFECWQNGGRSNCKNDQYRQIETDLHNLVPAIGEINADRSNFPHGIIDGEPRVYGPQVDAEVNFKASIFEPKEDIRGDIARMYFYMQQKYGLSLTGKEQDLYVSWDKCDPVDDWENERNSSIEAIQGNSNPFVTNYVNDASSCTSGGSTGGSTEGSTEGSNQSCDASKKYCSHMDSCSDAKYYLKYCGRIRLDGDKDGIPCEALCKSE